MTSRTHLNLVLKFPRATINALFYSEENKQEIISINQCAILKFVGKVGDRIIQNAPIFLFFLRLLGSIDNNDRTKLREAISFRQGARRRPRRADAVDTKKQALLQSATVKVTTLHKMIDRRFV